MQRIISLVPSITELLYDLGVDEEVVGITKFCIHPAQWHKTKVRIGGTKNINIQKIYDLKPTLVIANKEENVKEQVEALQNFTKVYVSDVSNLAEAKQMIHDVGNLTQKQNEATALIKLIEQKFSEADLSLINEIPAVYLIWRDPYITVGGDTFINDMMRICGFANIFSNKLRYPQIDIDELKKSDCKILLLSSEPFPFRQKHIDELQPQLPGVKILLVDGEIFSWYGSRLLKAPGYFKQLQKLI